VTADGINVVGATNGTTISMNDGAETVTVVAAAGFGVTGAMTVSGGLTGNQGIVTGVVGSQNGSVTFYNSTSGSITVAPPAGALGSRTLTLPTATDTLVGQATTDTLTNKTLTAPKFADLGFIADANGNELVIFDTVASAVNELTLTNAATGGVVTLAATGGDTDIGFNINSKGAEDVNINNSVQVSTTEVTFGVPIDATGFAITGAAGSFTTLAASGQITNPLGTLTADKPLSISETWNNSGVTFTGIKLSVTDPAANAGSSSTSKLLDLQAGTAGTTSVLSVSKTGKLTSAAGLAAGATIETVSSANIGWVSHTQIQSPTNGRLVVAYNTGGDQIASLQLGGSGHSNSYPQLYRAAGSTVVQFLQGASTSTWVDIKAAGGTFTGDVAVTGATTLTGNLTSNGALISTPQAVSTDVAANVTTLTTTFASGAGALTSTLAAGTSGQIKILSMITDGGGDVTVTVTNAFWGGAGTLVFDTAGDNVTLIYLNSKWQILVNNGVVAA